MSLTLTVIGSRLEGGNSDGFNRTRYTVSCTNPYTVGGESVSTLPYTKKFLGGRTLSVSAATATNLAGLANTAVFRSDASSTGTVTLQFLQGGTTTSTGLWVDNTTANISNMTFIIEVIGK